MAKIPYTLEQFRADQTLFYHDIPPVCVGVDVGQDGGRRVREYADVLLMTPEGCVVQGNYMWPQEWSLGDRATDCNGAGIYVVPWGELSGPYTDREVEQALACQDADFRMLSNAL